MLGVDWDTVRLFLHVLAATVWVGGQLTLAALVPVLRRQGPEAPRAAARRFNLVAWPAYGVLIATGIWNIVAAGPVTATYRTLPSHRR
jgi:putative copper export protein